MAKNTKTAFSIGVPIFVPIALAGGAAVWLWIYRKLSKRKKTDEDAATQTEVQQYPMESVRGLQNLGNTCYFDSTMQALVHTNLVFREKLENLGKKEEVVLNVLKFLSAMQLKTSKPYSPNDLHRMFGKKSPKFADYRQHDSHECLRNFLDNVRKEERDSSGAVDKRKVLTVVDSVFGGHFITVYICKECETPYHVCEALLDISLPIMIDAKDLAAMNSARGSNRKESRTVKLQTPKSQTKRSNPPYPHEPSIPVGTKDNKEGEDHHSVKSDARDNPMEIQECNERQEQLSEVQQHKEREEQHDDGQQHSHHTKLVQEHCLLNVQREKQHDGAEEQQEWNAEPKEVGEENKVEQEEHVQRVEEQEQQQELEAEERKEHERVQGQEQSEEDEEQAHQKDDTENEDEDDKETDEEADEEKEEDEEENDARQNPKQDQKLEEQHDEKHLLNDQPKRLNKGAEEQQGGQHVSNAKLEGEVKEEQREQDIEEQRQQEDEVENEEKQEQEKVTERQEHGKENSPRKDDNKDGDKKNEDEDEKQGEEEKVVEEKHKEEDEEEKVVEKKKEDDKEQNLEEQELGESDFEVEEYASETRDLYRDTVEKLMTPLSFSSPCLPNKERAISKHVTIDNCLMYFTRKEHIHKEYLCNPCYGKYIANGGEDVRLTSATKQTMIFNPPAILTLHLKRFELKPGGSVKRTDKITYGELLDIAPYCSSKCLRNDPACQNIWYSLYGVVVHHGDTLKSGHYMAYVKIKDNDAGLKKFLQEKYFDRDLTREQLIEMMQEKQPGETLKQPDGTWYCMNDSWFDEVPVAEVLNQEAYLLFYERMC